MVSFYRLTELGYRLPAGGNVLPSSAFAPVEEATRLLTDAEARASAIIKDAEEAYRQECARGYADGIAQGHLQSVERLLQESGALDAKLHELEGDLANLVIFCVRKLVDGFDDFARAEAVVRGALKQMRREKKAELRVSSAQLAHFRGVVETIAREFPEVELIDVIEDTTLVAPRVILETSIGRVESEFGERLAELEEIIRRTAAGTAEKAAVGMAEKAATADAAAGAPSA
jgi:type III secretion protein L